MSTLTAGPAMEQRCTCCGLPGILNEEEYCPDCSRSHLGGSLYAAEAVQNSLRGAITEALDYLPAGDVLQALQDGQRERGSQREGPSIHELDVRHKRALGVQIVTLTESEAEAVCSAVGREMDIDGVEFERRRTARDVDWLEDVGMSLTVCARVLRSAGRRHLALDSAVLDLLQRVELRAAERVQEDRGTEYLTQSKGQYVALATVCRKAKKATSEGGDQR